MPARLSPTERIRAQIDELFAGGQPLAATLEEAARLSVRLVIQAALEAEVNEFLGRDRYQRDPDAGSGYRNGHQPVEVKTTAGPVVLERPKLRATSQPFVSRLLYTDRVSVAGLLERRFAFDQAPAAYRWIDEHPQAAVKVAFVY